jgi:outer membrane immunogenic protein
LKRLMLAAALAFGAAGQALAADLPQPPPPQAPTAYVPTVAPVYNWGGIYWGLNGGYGFGSSEWTDPSNASVSSSTGDFDVKGFLGGGTLGLNFQSDVWVFGIEGDFDGSWLNGTSSSAFCGAVNLGAAAQCQTKNTWLGTVRGRVGYAADRVLFYGTAGGAFGNIEAGVNGLQNSTEFGWTAGAGIEFAVADNWTARVEYLFVDLGNATCNNLNTCGNDALGGPAANQTVKFDANLIRVGVDYLFR